MGEGRCSELLAGAEAYLPFLEVLDSLLQGPDAAAQALRQAAPTWYAQLVPLAAPINDAFANRIILVGASAADAGSNENATYETGEPLSGFGTGSLWWSWTAPRTGQAVATADGTSNADATSTEGGNSTADGTSTADAICTA